ncbi:MAG: hypothetical protein AAGD43_15260 [Pseudomonadota bacterium]
MSKLYEGSEMAAISVPSVLMIRGALTQIVHVSILGRCVYANTKHLLRRIKMSNIARPFQRSAKNIGLTFVARAKMPVRVFHIRNCLSRHARAEDVLGLVE